MDERNGLQEVEQGVIAHRDKEVDFEWILYASFPLNCPWRRNQPLVSLPWGRYLFLAGRYLGAQGGPGGYKIPSAQGPVSLDTSPDCVLATVEEHDWQALVGSRKVGVVLDHPASKADWHLAWPGHSGHPARGGVVDRS